MNNLENLLANDRPALVNIFSSSIDINCFRDCPAQAFCHKNIGIEGCAETRATWLLQEVADGWEQIEADARKPYYEYFGCRIICNNCPAVFSDGRPPHVHYGVAKCAEAKALDLVARCKALALEGASNGF